MVKEVTPRQVRNGIIVAYGLFCLLIVVVAARDFLAFAGGVPQAVLALADKGNVGSGFDRWMLVDAWTAAILFIFAHITRFGTSPSNNVLFWAAVVIAYMLAVWLHVLPNGIETQYIGVLGITLMILSAAGLFFLRPWKAQGR